MSTRPSPSASVVPPDDDDDDDDDDDETDGEAEELADSEDDIAVLAAEDAPVPDDAPADDDEPVLVDPALDIADKDEELPDEDAATDPAPPDETDDAEKDEVDEAEAADDVLRLLVELPADSPPDDAPDIVAHTFRSGQAAVAERHCPSWQLCPTPQSAASSHWNAGPPGQAATVATSKNTSDKTRGAITHQRITLCACTVASTR